MEELPAPEDIRGMTVRDRHGLIAGRVAELFVDRASGEVRYLGVAAGPTVDGHVLVPMEDVTSTSDPLDVELRVPYTGDHLRAGPVTDDGQAPGRLLEAEVHRHFDRTPYWDPRWRGRGGGGAGAVEARPGDLDEAATPRIMRWGT